MENIVKIEYTVNGHTVVIYCSIDEFRDMLNYGISDGRFRKEIDQFDRVLREEPTEVWIESDEPLQRHDRVSLKTKDGFNYRVLSVRGDDLIIQRMTPDPKEWWEGTVKRSEVIAFPPYKHS